MVRVGVLFLTNQDIRSTAYGLIIHCERFLGREGGFRRSEREHALISVTLERVEALLLRDRAEKLDMIVWWVWSHGCYDAPVHVNALLRHEAGWTSSSRVS